MSTEAKHETLAGVRPRKRSPLSEDWVNERTEQSGGTTLPILEPQASAVSHYGDGSPIEEEVVEHIRSCYLAHQLIFDWRSEDVLALDNMLVAHARQPYRGGYRFGRIDRIRSGEPSQRLRLG